MATDSIGPGDKPQPRRPLIQFSLRTLLLFVTLCAVACSLFVAWLQKEQRRTDAIYSLRGHVQYSTMSGWRERLEEWKAGPAKLKPPRSAVEQKWDGHVDVSKDTRAFDSPVLADGYEVLFWAGTTDAVFEQAHLRQLFPLRTLYICGTEVTDAALINLEALTDLLALDLSRTNITGAGLEHLKALKQLQWLKLSGTKATDPGMEYVAGLTNVEWLDLSNTEVTDAGLKHLARLTQLEWLDLTKTKATDAGLEHLKGLKQLRWLNLSNVDVTEAGVKNLKEALPKVAVVQR